MRTFGLLVSVVLLAGLASCAETAGPNYAYAPGDAYEPGYGYGAWPYAYGAWPQGYYCCGSRLVGIGRFHHFGHFGHGHFGRGGHHH
jgi:hypothetical protein